MSTSFYDILIAGTELPGLILGALCAKKGYRVLVVGQNGRSNHYVHGTYTFRRRAPIFTGLETSAAVKSVFSELSLSLEMRNRPKPYDPYYQVIFSDKRIDFSGKERSFDREVAREFPDEIDRIKQFYRSLRSTNELITAFLQKDPHLPPDGWFQAREFARLAQQFPALTDAEPFPDPLNLFPLGHPFRASMVGPALFTSGLDIEVSNPIPLVRCMGNLAHGMVHIEGGVDGLKEVFIQKIRQHASDYRPDVALDGLQIKRGRVEEAYVRDRREMIGCHVLVCNSNMKKFFQLVPAEHQRERYHHQIHTLQPTHYLFTVNIAVPAEAIPEGMAKNMFLIGDPNRALEDDNLIFVSQDVDKRPVMPNEKVRQEIVALAVMCRLRVRRFVPAVGFVQELSHRLLTRLKETVLPFLDEHLLATHSPWLGVDSLTGQLQVDGSAPIPVYRGAIPNTLDSTILPVFSDYKNILVAGEHIFAGFGFEGAFIAALNGFRRVCDMVVKKTILS
ncbi:MAG: hypothetical protein HUU55_18995 [Myxococcales bacterium]|nr:hypothetical protein [Myxococcales bacterium]